IVIPPAIFFYYSTLFDSRFKTLQQNPDEQVKDLKIDYVVDTIRKKYGFKSIVHANSIMEGGRAIARSSLVGGHAGGMSGLEGAEGHGKTY
ncbi:hypothetical protein P7E07_15425, partial [Enterococcus gallinarum]|nr:hypothetical protein [Enterococcus gallinarum]